MITPANSLNDNPLTSSDKPTLQISATPTVHALIVAAGKGSRFGGQVAKQYVQIKQRTLLEHSVARLATSAYIKQCLLVIAKDDALATTLDFAIPVTFTTGGVERWQSVKSGVEAILAAGADAEDLIVIHDAARPAVPTQDINQVIAVACQERYGAILATPVTDTLKAQVAQQPATAVADLDPYIARTVDRDGLWQALTPQVFRLGVLQHVMDHVERNALHITDEASAFEALSLPIRLVEGSRENLKLTYAQDLALLTAILSAQAPED